VKKYDDDIKGQVRARTSTVGVSPEVDMSQLFGYKVFRESAKTAAELLQEKWRDVRDFY